MASYLRAATVGDWPKSGCRLQLRLKVVQGTDSVAHDRCDSGSLLLETSILAQTSRSYSSLVLNFPYTA